MFHISFFSKNYYHFRCLLIVSLLFTLSSCSKKIYIVRNPSGEIFSEMSEPSANTKSVRKNYKKQGSKLIVIDAGHGGKDFGAEVSPALKEKNLNLMTARFLQGYLQKMGYRTLMTRNEDVFVSLDKRAQFANAVDSDLFVSVHFNSAPSTKANGIEVFYYRSDANKERSFASKELAESILKSVTDTTHAQLRGVKHGNLAVVRKTSMPAVLVEGGFLTNDAELSKIRDPAYLKMIAWGIAQGVQDYLQ